MTDDTKEATGESRPNANDPIPTDYVGRAKGMGVSLIDGGAAFRVWAPHAETVAVTGTFDDWAAQPRGDNDDPTGYYAQKRSTLGAALVLTSPGLPMIFQGQ